MRSRPNSSPTSAPCRFEWRPSRWLQACLLLLVALMPPSVALSDFEAPLAWMLASAAMGWGLWIVRREWRRPARRLLVPVGETPACVDGAPVEELDVRWQGPLVVVAWRRAGRRHELLFWPDTLPAAQRRELRLAMSTRRVPASTPQVAP